MIDLNKYSEKEVVAAILAVEEIVNCEDFLVDITEEDGGARFSLVDQQSIYLGSIGSDRFDSLAGVIDRMDTYHNDYFYADYEDRVQDGIDIPDDDFCRKCLMFLESDYVADLLSNIDVETYKYYTDKYLTNEEGKDYNGHLKLLNSKEYSSYVKDDTHFDFVGYLCDKSIAMEILKTESAYRWFEHDGKFYLSDYGMDEFYKSNEEFKEQVLKSFDNETFKMLTGPNTFDPIWTVFDTYAEVVNSEFGQIKDDMHDIGLYDGKDNWQFYLSEFELEYVGLGEEKDKLKDWYSEEIRIGSSLYDDMTAEEFDSHLDLAVEASQFQAGDTNKQKGALKFEKPVMEFNSLGYVPKSVDERIANAEERSRETRDNSKRAVDLEK